jgi:hypothetical protein
MAWRDMTRYVISHAADVTHFKANANAVQLINVVV